MGHTCNILENVSSKALRTCNLENSLNGPWNKASCGQQLFHIGTRPGTPQQQWEKDGENQLDMARSVEHRRWLGFALWPGLMLLPLSAAIQGSQKGRDGKS